MSATKPAPIQVAPSILSADFAALGRDIAAAERGGADLIHVDVMDGHFVPNITIGPPVVRAIKRIATRPLDVHLMIEEPDRYIEEFIAAGASMVSVHVEAVPHLQRSVTYIKKLGAKAGVVLNPSTPAAMLEDIAPDVDFVLVMSVNPGFGGQSFIPNTLKKLQRVRAVLNAAGSSAPIEIDGGIGLDNVAAVVAAGASILVAGQAIFGTSDPEGGDARAASGSEQDPGWITPARLRARLPPPRRALRPTGRRGKRAEHPRSRALCRHRSDGRRLLRQLPGLVRGRSHGVAA